MFKGYFIALYDPQLDLCVGTFDSVGDLANSLGKSYNSTASDISKILKGKHKTIISNVNRKKYTLYKIQE